jgi:hypothetical protein
VFARGEPPARCTNDSGVRSVYSGFNRVGKDSTV